MKKILSIVFVLALVLSLGAMARAPASVESSEFEYATTINVPGDYSTIQAAINASGAGDAMIVVASGEYEGFVVLDKADLLIRGTEEVTITSASPVLIDRGEIAEAWVMAAVKDSESIRIEGIDFDGSAIIGEQSVVGIAYLDSTGGILDLTVENMAGTDVGIGVAIIGAGGGIVRGTTIIGNKVGLYFFDNPVVEAHYNSIENNTLFGALNQGTTPVDALNNWWGSLLGPFHPEDNPTGTGNPVSDNVDFTPWTESRTVVKTVIGEGSIDAKEDADTEVYVRITNSAMSDVHTLDTNGDGPWEVRTTLGVSKFLRNPFEPDPALHFPLGGWIDVALLNSEIPEGTDIEIEIRFYYKDQALELPEGLQSKMQLMWWNGEQWAECNDRGRTPINEANEDGYRGFVWVKIRQDTIPPLSYLLTSEFGGYAGPTEIDDFCFIATAAYGTDTAQELDILREFRDTVLLPNRLGAGFVSFYYRNSPPVARFISRHEGLRTAVRLFLIDPVVNILNRTYEAWSRSDW
jgi:hypothetical protein